MAANILKKLVSYLRHEFLKKRKSADPVRWGIIGLGYMAETFSSVIDGNKYGKVSAVASRSISKAKAFAAKHGHCKAYGSYEAMVNDENLQLDIIYIATPVKCHYENIKLCLSAGKNVLCEKPITFDAEQLEELRTLAKNNNCFMMEGMWMKCLPTFQKALEWIRNNKIGKIELVKGDFYKRESIDPDITIFNEKEGGGVLRDFGVYAIAFVTHFLNGKPEKMSFLVRKSQYGIDADWQITASGNGRNAVVNLSSNFGSSSKAAVIGNDGMIEWDTQFNRTNRVCLYDKSGRLLEEFKAVYWYDGFEYEVAEVQECIKCHKLESQKVSLESSMETIRFIDRLMNSL